MILLFIEGLTLAGDMDRNVKPTPQSAFPIAKYTPLKSKNQLAMKELTNLVTDYRITLLGETQDRVFGWIKLLNVGKSVGFIYYSSDPRVLL